MSRSREYPEWADCPECGHLTIFNEPEGNEVVCDCGASFPKKRFAPATKADIMFSLVPMVGLILGGMARWNGELARGRTMVLTGAAVYAAMWLLLKYLEASNPGPQF